MCSGYFYVRIIVTVWRTLPGLYLSVFLAGSDGEVYEKLDKGTLHDAYLKWPRYACNSVLPLA